MRKISLLLVAVILVATACGNGPTMPGDDMDDMMELRRK